MADQGARSRDAIEYLAAHDRLLIGMSIVVLCSITGLATLNIAFFVFFVIGIRYFARKGYQEPDFLGQLVLPRNTYVLPFSFLEKLVPFGSTLRRFSDFLTLSFPTVNLVLFRPSTMKTDRLGFRKADLLHEFGHCNRYDALYLIASLYAALYFLRNAISQIWFTPNSEQTLKFYPVVVFLVGLLMLATLARVNYRREYIADIYAYSKEPDLYMKFMKTKASPIATRIKGSNTKPR